MTDDGFEADGFEPDSPAPVNPAQRVVDVLGPVEGALMAFGEGARHLIRQGGNYLSKVPGVAQLGAALGFPPDPTDEEVLEASRNLAPLRERFPIASALGSASLAVPTAVGAATVALPASLSVPQMAIGSALLGGAQGEAFSDPGQRISGRNAGVKMGAALPLAVGAGANVAGRVAARGAGAGATVPGRLTPIKNATPEARAMMEEGVPLTPGQQNPTGTWNQIEEATTSVPGVGPAVARMRGGAAERDLQRIFAKVAPPGEKPPPLGDPAEMLTNLKAGFDRAYAGVKGQLTRWGPTELPGRFSAVAADPNVVADDAVRASVGRFLQNQATAMGAEAPTVEKLLKVRSAIRSAAANAEGPALQLLRSGEAQVTEALSQGAPPMALARLKAIDRQYAQYKTLEDATRAAGDRALTHTDLSRAVARATPDAAYARGGGLLRQEAKAGKETFGSVSPATGQRLLTLSAGTPVVRHALGAASYLRANAATSPAAGLPARFASPVTAGPSPEAVQLSTQLGIPVDRAETLLERLVSGLRMAPSAADEQDRSPERTGTTP